MTTGQRLKFSYEVKHWNIQTESDKRTNIPLSLPS